MDFRFLKVDGRRKCDPHFVPSWQSRGSIHALEDFIHYLYIFYISQPAFKRTGAMLHVLCEPRGRAEDRRIPRIAKDGSSDIPKICAETSVVLQRCFTNFRLTQLEVLDYPDTVKVLAFSRRLRMYRSWGSSKSSRHK